MQVHPEKSNRESVHMCMGDGGGRGEARLAAGRRRPAHSLISHEVDLGGAERNPRELIASNE